MRISSRSRLRFLLLFLPCALVLGMPSLAQDPDLAFQQIVGQPRGLPQLPPQGAWGEIINATTRWIVIQNHSGQQYPISIEDIGEFLVRWPSSVDDLTANSWIEAVGPDLGSNILQTSHIDVFEGSDRTLVAPTYNRLLPNNSVVTTLDPGFNRLMNAWDYGGQLQLYGWAYPVSPGITRNTQSAPCRRQRREPRSAPRGPARRQLRRGHPGRCGPVHRQPGDPRVDQLCP